MSTRTARVIWAHAVTMRNEGRPALQVTTDHVDDDCAFYVQPDADVPEDGTVVTWGTSKAWWGGKEWRKLGFSFDPSKPL